MAGIPDYFGSMVFDEREMKARLSGKVYHSLKQTIRRGERLDPEVADAVANAYARYGVVAEKYRSGEYDGKRRDSKEIFHAVGEGRRSQFSQFGHDASLSFLPEPGSACVGREQAAQQDEDGNDTHDQAESGQHFHGQYAQPVFHAAFASFSSRYTVTVLPWNRS